MKYTPGLWIDISDGLHSEPPRMALIKTTAEFGDGMAIDATKSGKTFAESCANACLIAAAPELLEACHRAVENRWEPDKWRDYMEQAIAKAEGRNV